MLRTFLILLLISPACFAQDKVSHFSVQPDAKDFEELSFWSNGKIEYMHGAKSSTLKYLAPIAYKAEKAFQIVLPDGLTVFVIPKATYLQVTDGKNKYDKKFSWMYEGPENGVGTWCDECTQSPKEAIKLVNTFFLKAPKK